MVLSIHLKEIDWIEFTKSCARPSRPFREDLGNLLSYAVLLGDMQVAHQLF